MNRLQGVGARFKTKLKTVTGKEFYGQILQPPDTSRVSNFLSARRYLRTTPETPVVFGDVVITGDRKFIVADHAEGFYVDHIYTHFKMFEVDDELLYYPYQDTFDAVTGVKYRQVSPNGTKVYVSTQPKASISDALHIPTYTKVAICNADIPVDSKLGGYQVTRNDKMLGIYVLEMKKL